MGIVASLLEIPLESPGRVMFVTAHPDDEAMFFVPVLQSLRAMQLHVMLLCMSNGNAEGKGKIREAELSAACEKLHIKYYKICADSRLPDGKNAHWDKKVIASLITDEVWRCRIKTVITFDKRGVSGHPNHSAVYEGVRHMLSVNDFEELTVYALESPSLLWKFTSFCSIVPCVIYTYWKRCHGKVVACCITRNPLRSFVAMQMHRSQWTWYRQLFVLFASCTFVNVLRAL